MNTNANSFSIQRAIKAVIRDNKLTGIEAEISQEGIKEFRSQGRALGSAFPGNIYIPSSEILKQFSQKRSAVPDMSKTINILNFNGAFEKYSVLVQLGAKYIPGLNGYIKIPNTDDATAAWENEDFTDPTPITGGIDKSGIALTAFATCSKNLAMQEDSPVIENIILSQIMKAIIFKVQMAAINGSGSDEPEGILENSDLEIISLGDNGGLLSDDHLSQLEQILGSAITKSDSMAYLCNPDVRRILRRTPLDAGSGVMIWDRFRDQNADNRAGVTTSVPNNLTKGTGTDLSAIIAGNFEDLLLMQWGGYEVIVDQYSLAKSNLLKLHINSTWDVAITNPNSFCAIKDVKTS